MSFGGSYSEIHYQSQEYHVKQFLAIQWKILGHYLFSMQKEHSPCDTTGKVGWMAISLQGLYPTASTLRLNLTSSRRIYPILQFARTAI